MHPRLIRVSSVAAAVVAATLAACTTTPVTAPAPLPAPMPFDTAIARVAIRQTTEESVVVSGGRTILMSHGTRTSRVYLLLHGFTDAPTQFETVGGHLFADGANVLVPRLPHHAERIQPLRAIGRVRANELSAFGDSIVDVARGLGDSVIVVGLSAGGAIAGWIAQTHSVSRAVLLAPAIAPGVLSDGDAEGLVLIASRLPDMDRMTGPIDSTRPENIPGVSSRGLAELLRFGRRVYNLSAEHPPLTHDIAFVLNERDHTVSEQTALDLAQRWFDRGASVKAFRFDLSANLPHNIMELTAHGGNTDLVYPVVEALARGATPPTVHLLGVPCAGWRCRLRRSLDRPSR